MPSCRLSLHLHSAITKDTAPCHQVAKRQKNLKLKKGIEAQLNQMKELGNAKALEQAQIAHSSALSFVQVCVAPLG